MRSCVGLIRVFSVSFKIGFEKGLRVLILFVLLVYVGEGAAGLMVA